MVELCDPIQHCPEKCQGLAQKFLIYHHLYYHYRLQLYRMKEIKTRPPCQFVFIEGKPGTGKTFVTRTLRNCTRMLSNNSNSDMASAPTGCAAALIDGSTHC